MNLGLITSFIIAGMLLLGIAMMNINVQGSSAELTITRMVKSHVDGVSSIINDDIPNMGYDVNRTTMDSKGAIITYADTSRISFYRNLSQNPAAEPDLVTWEFMKSQEVSSSKNPNHRVLVRTVIDGETGEEDRNEIRNGVTRFDIFYYTEPGSTNPMPRPNGTDNVNNIRQIHIIMEMQSAEPIHRRASDSGRYIRSVWDKRYTPPNINL